MAICKYTQYDTKVCWLSPQNPRQGIYYIPGNQVNFLLIFVPRIRNFCKKNPLPFVSLQISTYIYGFIVQLSLHNNNNYSVKTTSWEERRNISLLLALALLYSITGAHVSGDHTGFKFYASVKVGTRSRRNNKKRRVEMLKGIRKAMKTFVPYHDCHYWHCSGSPICCFFLLSF